MNFTRTFSPVRRLILPLALVCITGCSTLQAGSDYDRNASFTNMRRFTVMHREHHTVHNSLVVQCTEDAIKDELAKKGYHVANSPGEADFSWTLPRGPVSVLTSTPIPSLRRLGMGGWGQGPGWWGAPIGEMTSTYASFVKGPCRLMSSIHAIIGLSGTDGRRRSSASRTFRALSSRFVRLWPLCWRNFPRCEPGVSLAGQPPREPLIYVNDVGWGSRAVARSVPTL